MTDPASLTDRRNATPRGRAETWAWMERADEELKHVAAHPNEIIPRLISAGCTVAFRQHEDGIRVAVDVRMPDESVVTETGANPVHALILAYGAGAWLADLPRLLAATEHAPAPEGASPAPVLPFAPERTTTP